MGPKHASATSAPCAARLISQPDSIGTDIIQICWEFRCSKKCFRLLILHFKTSSASIMTHIFHRTIKLLGHPFSSFQPSKNNLYFFCLWRECSLNPACQWLKRSNEKSNSMGRKANWEHSFWEYYVWSSVFLHAAISQMLCQRTPRAQQS